MTISLPAVITLNTDGTYIAAALVSPDGAYIGAGSTATAIYAGPASVWTVINGVVMLNGAAAGFSANVATLLWFKSLVWQSNTAGGWWYWDVATGTWAAVAGDPRVTVTPAPTPTPTPNPASAPGGALSIRNVNGILTDQNNKPVNLRILNFSGFEQWPSGSGLSAGGFGNSIPLATMKAWGANAVRFCLNSAAWLGLNGAAIGGGTGRGDPSNSYQASVISAVNEAIALGMYAILDLHWDAPGSYINAAGQTQMPSQDHAIAHWLSVAATFAGNQAVILEPYNEPVPSSNNPPSAADRAAVLNGGMTFSQITFTAGSSAITYPWTATGYQPLVDAIRTKAKNLILTGSAFWSSDLIGWLSYAPKDPLNNLGCANHMYHEMTAAEKTAQTAIIAAGYPVVHTECGYLGGTSSANMAILFPFCDSLPAGTSGYGGWCFNNWGAAADTLIIDANCDPSVDMGQYLKAHFMAQQAAGR